MTSARASGFSPWSGPSQALFVLALCLASRLATSIHYIEDPDSLRFALALVDYDVARLQPQFPGYPAFCFAAKSLSLFVGTGRAFALLGGLGLFAMIHYSLALARWRFAEPRGLAFAALAFFNPMLWLLGNRYMSDLSGAALALAAFYHLSRSAGGTGAAPEAPEGPETPEPSGPEMRKHLLTGFFLAGLLAGWRLSYVPFLVLPLGFALARREEKRPGATREKLRAGAAALMAGAAGVAVWLVPFIFVTGWKNLLAVARFQTAGHFDDFGGTYRTEPEWGLRAARLLGRLWTDGLGAWEPGRHGATLLVAAGAAVFLTRAVRKARAALSASHPASASTRLLLAAWAGYAVWIFLFQNVVHQSRHALPLIAPLLLAIAGGLPRDLHVRRARRAAWTAAFLVFLGAYAFVGATLALQHRRPAAIAQAKAHVETFGDPDLTLVAAPWVVKCLSAQGVKARWLAVETPSELAALRRLDPALPLATVGDYSDHLDRPVAERRAFYHNPYVNRLGARVDVLRYDPVAPRDGGARE